MDLLRDLLAMTVGIAVIFVIVWSVHRVHGLCLFSEESRRFMHTGPGFLTLWAASIVGNYTGSVCLEAARTWPAPVLSIGPNPLLPFVSATAIPLGLWFLPAIQAMFDGKS